MSRKSPNPFLLLQIAGAALALGALLVACAGAEVDDTEDEAGTDSPQPGSSTGGASQGPSRPPTETGVLGGSGGQVTEAGPSPRDLEPSNAAGAGKTDAAGDSPADGSSNLDDGDPLDGSGSDNAPPTNTFPAVGDVGANGPFTATTLENVGPGNGYTLYHPVELAPDGALNPIVSWGNGGFTTPTAYPMLPHLATHGFVVIASNNPFVAGADVRAGIEWLLEQNDDSASPFYHKLDTDNIAGVGYSLGGLATYEIAGDPGIATIVIISGASTNADLRTQNLPKLRTPIAYFCTSDDASKGNCAGDYNVVQVPAFFGVMNGSAHTDVADILGLGVPAIMDRMQYATTAWLRWQQMNDQSLESMFVGDDCGLCTDSNWTVEPQKNLQ